MPLLRCAKHVLAGSKDLMPKVTGRHERLVYTNTPVQYYAAGFIVRADSDFELYKGMQQFKNKSVGVLRGNSLKAAHLQYKDIQWVKVNTGRSQWLMLVRGRVDAAYGDLIAFTALESYNSKKIRFLYPPFSINPTFMGFHRSRKDWRDKFSIELERMLADGSISEIYKKHSILSFESILVLVERGYLEKP